MVKRDYFSLFRLFFLCIALMVLVLGCANSENQKVEMDLAQSEQDVINNDPIYSFYNQVELNDTKEDVDKVLAVQAELDGDGLYNYLDPASAYGVFVGYDIDNRVKTKGIYMPEGPQKLIALSGARVREEELQSIHQGMSYDEVVSVLGPGAVEIIATKNANDQDNHYYALGWINEDESLLLVYFLGFKGRVERAEFIKNT